MTPPYIFRRTSGIIIPTSFSDCDFFINIAKHLTRTQKDFQTDTWITNAFFIQTKNAMVIPRYFPIEDYIPCKIEDDICEGKDILINHSITARDEIQEKFMKLMLEKHNGIIQLNPGIGKTVLSIHTVATKKKKTFILVHRTSLVEQWIERFIAFTDITKDRIGILSTDKFEKALSCDIVVSTTQSFISAMNRKQGEFINALKEAQFGIFIGDEVHTTVGAPTFSQCSILLPSRINFGLSATPYRFDGNEDIIQYHLGPIYESDDSGSTVGAKVTIVLLDFQVDIPKRKRWLYWQGKFQKARYLNIIKNSDIFMTVAEGILRKVENSEVIYIAERLKLLDILFKKCKNESKAQFIAGVGNSVLREKVVFSTPGKIRDGVDASWKDTLVLTSPISNINQMCGRVLRKHEGKEKGTIIDIVDIGCESIKNCLFKRIEFYKLKEWQIQYLFINPEGKKTFVEEDEAIRIVSNIL